jgi:hypothetical protein
MQFQIDTEKPNAVAFTVPLEGSAASPEKITIMKERLEKRLAHGADVSEPAHIEEVNGRLSKAKELRDTRIKEQTKVL